jgi:acetolactate synthase I/II/III large subunit
MLNNIRTSLEQAGYLVLASCLGEEDTGGGLFSFDGSTVKRLDRLSCTGLTIADNRLIRLLRGSDEPGVGGELLVYDPNGVECYFRIDDLCDGHSIIWDGYSLIAVSTLTNSILWISPSGKITKKWQAPGENDSWHLNSLFIKDDEIFVSTFGKFQKYREWSEHINDNSGLVFNLLTGQDIIKGLSCPHNPVFIDGNWIICNSATKELLQIDASTGTVLARLQLNGWTRGIAICNDLLFVGESANRITCVQGETASIVVVSRKDWILLDRFQLPCREVYDLVLTPAELVEGVCRGFRTNPLRLAEQNQYAMFDQVGITPARLWAIGDPLQPEDCKIKIEAVLPDQMEADSVVELEASIENLGTAFLVTAPPYPVYISYKWMENGRGSQINIIEGIRSRLVQSLPPRNSMNYKFRLKTPPTPGEFILCLTLVQEQVAWFNDLDEKNSFIHPVHIVQPSGGLNLTKIQSLYSN